MTVKNVLVVLLLLLIGEFVWQIFAKTRFLNIFYPAFLFQEGWGSVITLTTGLGRFMATRY